MLYYDQGRDSSGRTEGELQVAASIPANEATDVTADIRMVVRFTRLLLASAGVTALYGRSRTSLGKYLPGVTLTLDCAGKTATAQRSYAEITST